MTTKDTIYSLVRTPAEHAAYMRLAARVYAVRPYSDVNTPAEHVRYVAARRLLEAAANSTADPVGEITARQQADVIRNAAAPERLKQASTAQLMSLVRQLADLVNAEGVRAEQLNAAGMNGAALEKLINRVKREVDRRTAQRRKGQ